MYELWDLGFMIKTLEYPHHESHSECQVQKLVAPQPSLASASITNELYLII